MPPLSRLTVFTAVLFFLPALHPGLFGWMNGILAVPVCIMLFMQGKKEGIRHLQASILLAGVGALLLQHLELFLFSLTLIPLGFALAKGAEQEQEPVRIAGKGILTLGLTWFLFWMVYGMITGIHPYQELLTFLDEGFAQTYEVYKEQAKLSAEALYTLEQTIQYTREGMPRILPGFLLCIVIVTVWVNLLLSHRLLKKLSAGSPWGNYASWTLPDHLIWLPIGATVLFLVTSGLLQDMGLWGILVSCVLYFFQGLAVIIHLFNRWKVPPYARLFFYILLILQSYGLVLVSILGAADVWFPLRQKNKKTK